MVKLTVIFFIVVILAVYDLWDVSFPRYGRSVSFSGHSVYTALCGNDLLTKTDREKIRGVRTVEEENTNITQFPHQASLEIAGYHFCGASLISNRWLITAAHCTSTFNSNQTSLLDLIVRLGTILRGGGGQNFSVARVINHPLFAAPQDRYDPRYTLHYDISLIYLSQEVTFGPTIQPIKLAEASEVLLPGTICTATGWDRRSKEAVCLTAILQTVNVTLISNEICESMLTESRNSRYTKIPADMLCAGFHDRGRDACGGEPGGPLIAQGSLIGVTSWGDGCYTSVQYFRDWIRENSEV